MQEEIDNLSKDPDSPEHEVGDSTLATLSDSRDVLAAHGVVTVNQKSLRANLEAMRLKQTRLLLSYQGEGLERKLSQDMDSAQEAIERAKEAAEMEAKRRRLREEEEERERERLKKEAEQHKRYVSQSIISCLTYGTYMPRILCDPWEVTCTQVLRLNVPPRVLLGRLQLGRGEVPGGGGGENVPYYNLIQYYA